MLSKHRGFTLIELTALVVILAVAIFSVVHMLRGGDRGDEQEVCQIVKLGTQDLKNRTWETQLICNGMDARSRSFETAVFDFTIEKEGLFTMAQQYMLDHTDIRITYRVKDVPPGSHHRFLVSIEPVSK